MFFGTTMAANMIGTGRTPVWGGVLTGLAMGAFFGLFKGCFFRSQNRDGAAAGRFPVGTDPERAARAYELLLLGQPGEDRETNEIAREQAERTLASRSRTWAAVPLLLLFAAVCGGMAMRAHLDHAPSFFSASFFALMGALLLVGAVLSVPLNARARSRARDFLTALETHDGPG